MGWIIFGLIFVLVVAWFVKSIKIVGPKEMAVLVLFGKSNTVYDSGFQFVPFLPGCYLERYPKTLYNLDYQARKVITKAGRYPSEEPDAPEYGAQAILIDAVAYVRFPLPEDQVQSDEPGERDKKGLIKILESQIPTNKQELLTWTEDSVVGALRIAFGGITWKEATEKIDVVRKKANRLFIAYDGAMVKAGFNPSRMRLTVKEIHLPKPLEDKMSTFDEQRIEAEAANFKAQQRGIETGGTLITIFSETTGMSRADIQTGLREKPEEFVKKHSSSWNVAWEILRDRMAIDGRSFLRVVAPGGTSVESIVGLFKRIPMGRAGERGTRKRKAPDF